MQVMLEGQQFEVVDPCKERRPDSFWPILRPLDSLGRLDYSVFGKRGPEDRVMMYTLLMDDVPVDQTRVVAENPPKYKKGARLDITDKFFGSNYLISWRFFHGTAIASTPILYGTSVEDLVDNNLLLVQKEGDHVYGKQ